MRAVSSSQLRGTENALAQNIKIRTMEVHTKRLAKEASFTSQPLWLQPAIVIQSATRIAPKIIFSTPVAFSENK